MIKVIEVKIKRKRKIKRVLVRRCWVSTMVFILELDKTKVNMLPICIVT